MRLNFVKGTILITSILLTCYLVSIFPKANGYEWIEVTYSKHTVYPGGKATYYWVFHRSGQGIGPYAYYSIEPKIPVNFKEQWSTPNKAWELTVEVPGSVSPGTYWVVIEVQWGDPNDINTYEKKVKLEVLPLDLTITAYTTFSFSTSTPTSTIPPSTSTPPPQTQTPGPGSPTFDFVVAVSPSTMETRGGESVQCQVIIEYSDPVWSGTPISLQVEISEWMQWDLSPTRELTITTPQDTPPGTYIFSVIGEAQGVTRGVDVNLIIIEGSGEPHQEEPHEELPPEEEQRRHAEEEERRLREEEEQRHIEEEQRRAEEEERRKMDEKRFTLPQLTNNPLFWVTIVLVVIVVGLVIAYMRKGALPIPIPQPSGKKILSLS